MAPSPLSREAYAADEDVAFQHNFDDITSVTSLAGCVHEAHLDYFLFLLDTRMNR